MHKVGMRLICIHAVGIIVSDSCYCLKYGYSKPKCHILYNVQLFFVSVQRTAQTIFRTFLQSRIMVDGAKFKSHDSGGHL